MKKISIFFLIYIFCFTSVLNIRSHNKYLQYLGSNINKDQQTKPLTDGEKVVRFALENVGKFKYSFGGGDYFGPTFGDYNPEYNVCDDRNTFGLDCGGFVLYCFYQALGIKLPHGPSTLYKKALKDMEENKDIVRIIPRSEAQPGDLLFYHGHVSKPFRHVVIYAGNGMVVQSEGHYKHTCVSKLTSYDKLDTFELADIAIRFW